MLMSQNSQALGCISLEFCPYVPSFAPRDSCKYDLLSIPSPRFYESHNKFMHAVFLLLLVLFGTNHIKLNMLFYTCYLYLILFYRSFDTRIYVIFSCNGYGEISGVWHDS